MPNDPRFPSPAGRYLIGVDTPPHPGMACPTSGEGADGGGRIEWSDEWSEEDLADATAAALERFDEFEAK